MDATEVRAALARRWPDDRYLHIPEAPLSLWRQGGKIDVLIVALWQSLRLEVDAVEIKVSYQDWKREIEQRHLYYVEGTNRRFCANMIMARWYQTNYPGGEIVREVIPTTAKSELWRNHAHRFWIACPNDLAARIVFEIPEGWGLLGCSDQQTSIVVKPAVNKTPVLLDWPRVVGLLRTAADCGFNALARAEARGEQRAGARQAAELKYAEQRHADDWDEIMALREQVRVLERETPPPSDA